MTGYITKIMSVLVLTMIFDRVIVIFRSADQGIVTIRQMILIMIG